MRRLLALATVAILFLGACGDDESDDPLAREGDTSSQPAGQSGGQGGGQGGGDHTDHGGAPTATCSPAGTTLTITVQGTKFDKNCLAAPANQAFTINYDNKDSIAHNIAILESHTSPDVLFRAEVFRGPRMQPLSVSALKAGTYAFHCEVHPNQMSGTFVVK